MPDLGVLLVEDERLLDRVIADALRTVGFACDAAHSEEEAIARLRQRRYELMILDLRLRHGSGVAVLQQARQLHPEILVVLVTAYTVAEETQSALALGVDALLYKPFDIDTLIATVRGLLCRYPVVRCASTLAQQPAERRLRPTELLAWLEVGGLATLKTAERSLACRVWTLNEQQLSVETERIEPPYPPRWIVEWTGCDALYRFRARVLKAVVGERSVRWLLRLPSLIRRIQRRRHPRLRVDGRAVVSIAGRPQRAIEAELVDLSEEGACILLTEPPHRGAHVYLDAQAETELGAIAFQREGIVRSVVAFAESGQPRYRVGLQLERLPRAVVQQLRQLQQTRLISP